MHYSIIIISNIPIENKFNNSLLINNNNLSIIDENTLKVNNELIYFDYLILNINIENSLNLMKDNNKYVTNCFHQTSIDNIFAIGESSSSSKDIKFQLEDIYDFLINN